MEEGNQSLALQLREVEDGLCSTINGISSSAIGYFRKDDDFLEKLGAMSVLEPDHGKGLEARVAELTSTLSDLTREEIECRLNRTYLQHLTGNAVDRKQESNEHVEAELEQDLQSLHVEIPDVAAMSIFQDFRAPLLRALADRQNRKNVEAQRVLEEVSDQDPSIIISNYHSQ